MSSIAPCKSCHILIVLTLQILTSITNADDIAPSPTHPPAPISPMSPTLGYIVFCPCMGRFGNQVDQVLGALAFAKKVNRTLILPPWINYHSYPSYDSNHVPFEDYFSLAPVVEYHPVVTMETFMEEGGLAGTVWPESKRIAYCPGPSPGKRVGHCNPQGSFWKILKVEFIDSKFFSPMDWDSSAQQWNAAFPLASNPVFGFPGAPAVYPLKSGHRHLQSLLEFKPEIVQKANLLIAEFPDENYLGIHLRNKIDWTEACKEIQLGRHHFFASKQCLGDNFEHGMMTKELCTPPKQLILKKIKMSVRRLNISTIFIASDNDYMTADIEQSLERRKVKTVRLPENLQGYPLEIPLTLTILSRSKYFIGNCASSFTAFVVRQRDLDGNQSGFWSIKGIGKTKAARDEL